MSEKWLEELQQTVADRWEWQSAALEIRFQYTKPDQDEDFWEVWVYPALQEIVGGKEDGETVWSGFNFDVLGFLKEFEAEAVDISTRQPSHPSELAFEGKFRGQYVFLHVCLEPPDDAEATEIVDLSGPGGPVVRDKE
jgi:hypothetical protein